MDVLQGSYLDPQHYTIVNTIQLQRIYDLLWAIYYNADQEGAMQLRAVHAAGGSLAPNPAYAPEEE